MELIISEKNERLDGSSSSSNTFLFIFVNKFILTFWFIFIYEKMIASMDRPPLRTPFYFYLFIHSFTS
jgi:hypothetical protein